MPAVAPFTVADTADAAHWLDYIAAAFAPGPASAPEAEASARRAIGLLRRTDQISDGAAALLLQIFDLVPLDLA